MNNEEINFEKLFRIFLEGWYIILTFSILAMFISAGFYFANRKSKVNYFRIQPYNVNTSFFDYDHFTRMIVPSLRKFRVKVSVDKFVKYVEGERTLVAGEIRIKGKKENIEKAYNDLKGRFIQFEIQNLMQGKIQYLLKLDKERDRLLMEITSLKNFVRNAELGKSKRLWFGVFSPFNGYHSIFQISELYSITQLLEKKFKALEELIDKEERIISEYEKYLSMKPEEVADDLCLSHSSSSTIPELEIKTLCIKIKILNKTVKFAEVPPVRKNIIVFWTISGFILGIFTVLLIGVFRKLQVS